MGGSLSLAQSITRLRGAIDQGKLGLRMSESAEPADTHVAKAGLM
tara:strand:+ start:3166 stop:3300 length:135 start_codon:yes stop_codon:yes gene_type:complete